MISSNTLPRDGADTALATADNLRSEHDFDRAHRHTFHVHLLKWALPGSATAVVALFVASIFMSTADIKSVDVSKSAVSGDKLVMEAPNMAGFDENNRPYDVKADRAVQDLKKPDMVELENINAALPMDSDGAAKVNAKRGFFNAKTEQLELTKQVLIKGARGMDITMQDARFDIKTGTMKSANPVSVSSQSTKITADSVTVEDSGERIIFRNRVRTVISKPLVRGTAESSQ